MADAEIEFMKNALAKLEARITELEQKERARFGSRQPAGEFGYLEPWGVSVDVPDREDE